MSERHKDKKDLAQRAVEESPARDHGIKQARQALLKALDQCPRAMTSPGSARLARISSGMHRQCVHGSGGGRGQEQAARGQGPGRACEAAARGQAAHLPSSLRQQAGREEALRRAAQRSRSFTAKGFYPVRHEDLHARSPESVMNPTGR